LLEAVERSLTRKLPTVQDELNEMDRENAIINVIARAASDPNTDVDKLERLLAMQERVLEREAEQRVQRRHARGPGRNGAGPQEQVQQGNPFDLRGP
jgi:hypothetical protein